jgi:hypothetical protein
MKAYLIVTGLIFALLTVLHVWKAIAEWTAGPGYLAGVAVFVAIPAAFSAWAWWLLRKLSDCRTKQGKGE